MPQCKGLIGLRKVYEAIQREKCAGLQNSIKTDTFNGNPGENPKRFNGKRA